MLRTLRRGATRAAAMASLLVVHAGFTSIEALFAPDADLWERWTAHDRTSAARVDHSTWSRILATYTRPAEDGLTRFAYGAVTPSDRDAVADYVGQLAAVPVSRLNRAEQRASWINLYNALTVRVVLEHYPVTTILDIDISPGWLADGPWDKALVKIEGEAVTLNDIEHRILRPIWRDPRIHYALNCASVGCPNLQGRAFTADNAEELLDDGARAYVNSPRGAHLQDGELVVSSIYVWFAEDFGRDNAEIIAHLATYATPELGVALSRYDDIDGHEYDWDLNDAAN